MSDWSSHLVLAPILLPLLAGAGMLLFDERNRTLRASLGLVSTVLLIVVAATLLYTADAAGPGSSLSVYRLGDWPAPFGIVLVLAKLSALMLMLPSFLALAALVFSLARWPRAGVYFPPLFQFLLVGVTGELLI